MKVRKMSNRHFNQSTVKPIDSKKLSEIFLQHYGIELSAQKITSLARQNYFPHKEGPEKKLYYKRNDIPAILTILAELYAGSSLDTKKRNTIKRHFNGEE